MKLPHLLFSALLSTLLSPAICLPADVDPAIATTTDSAAAAASSPPGKVPFSRQVTIVSLVFRGADGGVFMTETGLIFRAAPGQRAMDVVVGDGGHSVEVTERTDTPSLLEEPQYPPEIERTTMTLTTTLTNAQIFDPHLWPVAAGQLGDGRTSLIEQLFTINELVWRGLAPPMGGSDLPFERAPNGFSFTFIRALLASALTPEDEHTLLQQMSVQVQLERQGLGPLWGVPGQQEGGMPHIKTIEYIEVPSLSDRAAGMQRPRVKFEVQPVGDRYQMMVVSYRLAS